MPDIEFIFIYQYNNVQLYFVYTCTSTIKFNDNDCFIIKF